MERILIHPLAGVLSAFGIGIADVKAIREAEWFADNPPEVRISPHSTFGRAM